MKEISVSQTNSGMQSFHFFFSYSKTIDFVWRKICLRHRNLKLIPVVITVTKLKQFKMEIEYLWCILVVFNNYLENGKSVVYFLSSQPNCTANPIYNDSSVIFLKPKSLGEHTNSTRITSLGQRALAERRRVWKVYLCKPGSSWEKSNTKYVPSEKCPLVNLIYHYWTTHPPHTLLL